MQGAVLRRQMGSAARRGGISLLIAMLFLWLLSKQLGALDFAAVMTALENTPLWRWGFAAFLTLLSFAAVARYDVVAHRYLRSPVSPSAAIHTGWTATAISQTLGAGLATGAFSRWRLLGEDLISPLAATKVTLCVILAFFLAGQ